MTEERDTFYFWFISSFSFFLEWFWPIPGQSTQPAKKLNRPWRCRLRNSCITVIRKKIISNYLTKSFKSLDYYNFNDDYYSLRFHSRLQHGCKEAAGNQQKGVCSCCEAASCGRCWGLNPEQVENQDNRTSIISTSFEPTARGDIFHSQRPGKSFASVKWVCATKHETERSSGVAWTPCCLSVCRTPLEFLSDCSESSWNLTERQFHRGGKTNINVVCRYFGFIWKKMFCCYCVSCHTLFFTSISMTHTHRFIYHVKFNVSVR